MKKLMTIIGLFLSFNLLAHVGTPEYFSYSMSVSGAKMQLTKASVSDGWYVKKDKSDKMLLDAVTGMEMFSNGAKDLDLHKNLPFQKKIGMYSVTVERTVNDEYKMTMKYGSDMKMVRYLSLTESNLMEAEFMVNGQKMKTFFVFHFKDKNMDKLNK